MEFADLQELWVATSGYQESINVAMTYGANNDLQEAKMRLDKAMKATDIAGIPEMLCKFDLYKTSIIGNTRKYQERFNDFLSFISQHRIDIWKIDRSIGEIEKFMRGVADSLRDGKKALDEKGRSTPSPMDKDAAKLAEAYINGDFPSLTDEAFVNDLLKDCLLISEKKRRVDYLLSLPLDLSVKVRKLMQKAIEEPKPAPAKPKPKPAPTTTEPEMNYDSLFDEGGLTRICTYCHKEKYLPTSYDDFLFAVYYADFSKILKTIIEKNIDSKTKLRYIISYLRKQAINRNKDKQVKNMISKWYKASAKSIGFNDTGRMSGAMVTKAFKDGIDEAYNEPLIIAEMKAKKEPNRKSCNNY